METKIPPRRLVLDSEVQANSPNPVTGGGVNEKIIELDSQNVKLAGNQMINGVKTFNDYTYFITSDNNEQPLVIKDPRIPADGKPSKNVKSEVYFTDNEGNIVSYIASKVNSSGYRQTSIGCRSLNDEWNELVCGFYADGLWFTRAPTPSPGVSSNTIATCDWVPQRAAWSAMPSSTYTNLTLGATATQYTAPANGYVSLRMPTNAGNYIEVRNNTASGAGFLLHAVGNGSVTMFTMPVGKGDTFQVNYTATGTPAFFRFISAKGAV